MFKYIGISFLLIICFFTNSISQEIEVNGGFLQEDIKIGEPVKYYLTAKYPKTLEILFPGENFDYQPFEYLDKRYFPSDYDSAFVIDSAVYTLTSFEIDPVQRLALPVFLISGNDSTRIETSPDSLLFIEMVPNATDTTSLITDLAYTDVPLEFNYPYLLIAIGVITFVIFLILIIFGKKIINLFRIRKVKSGYAKFSEHFDELVYLVNKTRQKDHLEAAIAYWKKYLEKLEKKPYTKLTTREMIALNGDERLRSDLKEIDRNLYGRMQSGDIVNKLNSIKNLAQEYHEKKIAAIKNG